jgi:hypothetical protein
MLDRRKRVIPRPHTLRSLMSLPTVIFHMGLALACAEQSEDPWTTLRELAQGTPPTPGVFFV